MSKEELFDQPDGSTTQNNAVPEDKAAESIEQDWEAMRRKDKDEAEQNKTILIKQEHNPLGDNVGKNGLNAEAEESSSKDTELMTGEKARENNKMEEPTNGKEINSSAEIKEGKNENNGIEVDKSSSVWNVLTAEQLKGRQERVDQNKSEKYGVEIDKSSSVWKVLKGITKTAANTAGSILGVRSLWEVPKWAVESVKKGKQRNQLSGLTMDLLDEARNTSKAKLSGEFFESNIKAEAEKIAEEHKTNQKLWVEGDEILTKDGIEKNTPEAGERMRKWYQELARERVENNEKASVQAEKKERGADSHIIEKVKELEGKLKQVKMPPEEKKVLRNKMGRILKEHRHKDKDLDGVKTEKIEKLLDIYINSKAQRLLAAKEALNTVSVVAMMPMLRVAGYSAFSVAERWRKVAEQYDKKDGENGESRGKVILKGLTIDALKETAHGLSLGMADKENKGASQRVLDFASSAGVILRFAGLAEAGVSGYENLSQTGAFGVQEGTKKLWNEIANGNFGLSGALGQAGQNWWDNLDRLVGRFGYHLPHSSAEQKLELASDQKAAEELHRRLAEHQKVTAVFGENSELSNRILSGGINPQETRLIETVKSFGLAPDDFKDFHGGADQLNQLVEKVNSLEGGHQSEIMKAVLAHPADVSAKLDNPLIQNVLKNKLSADHIKELLSAKDIKVIDKPGGNISELFHKAMARDAKVTIVNPDGSVLKNFDANLAHQGDAIARNADDSFTVFKTSGTLVKEGQSLTGVYGAIEAKLNNAGVPKEMQNIFNKGEGYWGEKITRGESGNILHWWNEHKDSYGKMTDEQQQEFLRKIAGAKGQSEIDKLFGEVSHPYAPAVEMAHIPETASVPVSEAIARKPSDVIPNFAKKWKDASAESALPISIRTDMAYGKDELLERKDLSLYLNKLREETGFQPRNNKETVEDYIKRTREFLDKQAAIKEGLKETAEAPAGEMLKHWPPDSGQAGADRIAWHPDSEAIIKGGEFNTIKVSDNIKLGSSRAVVNHITKIFGEKSAPFSTAQDLDKISAWKDIKDKAVSDVASGKFGKPSGWSGWLGGHKKQEQYDDLRKYLKDLKEKYEVKPDNKETVGDYVKRAEEWLSRKRSSEGGYSPDVELKK